MPYRIRHRIPQEDRGRIIADASTRVAVTLTRGTPTIIVILPVAFRGVTEKDQFLPGADSRISAASAGTNDVRQIKPLFHSLVALANRHAMDTNPWSCGRITETSV